MAELSRVFVPFGDVIKTTVKTEDGLERPARIVKGPATDETLDLDKQIVDYAWAKAAFGDWFSKWANVREQHSSKAVGKGKEIEFDDSAKSVVLAAKIVDPDAIVKIDEGVLQGFSVGIKGARVVKDAGAPNGRIVGGQIVETSVVDHPANESCKFVVAKAAKTGLEKSTAVEFLDEDDDEVLTKVADAEEGKDAEPDVEKRKYSTAQRVAMAKKGQALPVKNDKGETVDGRYPIADEEDLGNAVRAIGRTKEGDVSEVKTYIKRRARALGATDSIPDTWKDAESDVEKELTGDEEIHNDALLSARNAIRELIQQEVEEDEPGQTYQIQYLIDALCSLDCFESSEQVEEQYSQMVVEMAAVSDKEQRRGLYKGVAEALKTAADAHKNVKAGDSVTVTDEAGEAVLETVVEDEKAAKPQSSDEEDSEEEDDDEAAEEGKAAAPDTEKFLTVDAAKAVIADQLKAILPEILKEHPEVLGEVLADKFASKEVEAEVAKLGKRALPGGPVINPEAAGLRSIEKAHPVNQVLEPGEVPVAVLSEMAKYAELAKSDDLALAQSAKRMLARLKAQHGLDA